MKKCSACFTEKPLTEYYVQSTTKDGRQSMCKACAHAYNKAWKALQKDKPATVIVQAKECLLCHVTKPASQFGKKSIRKDKMLEYCKPCWNKYIQKKKNAKKSI